MYNLYTKSTEILGACQGPPLPIPPSHPPKCHQRS
jgi:hypothetical protein